MMQSLRVAAVSMNGFLGEPERVLAAMDDWCKKAASEGAELVLFPELLIHGHCTPNTWELAEAVPDGPSTRKVEALAKTYGLFLSVGLCEKQNDLIFNTQILVGPEGYIGKQRKIHLSRDEGHYYKGGCTYPVFDIGKCKVGTVICYDNQIPENARMLALHGADVILMPHAARIRMWDDTPESITAARQESYRTFAMYSLRLKENACFGILADQVGRAGYVPQLPKDHHNQPHHAGGALIFAPDGEILAASQRELIEEDMIVQDLDAGLLAAERAHPNYTLRTRRPELFADLAKEQVDC